MKGGERISIIKKAKRRKKKVFGNVYFIYFILVRQKEEKKKKDMKWKFHSLETQQKFAASICMYESKASGNNMKSQIYAMREREKVEEEKWNFHWKQLRNIKAYYSTAQSVILSFHSSILFHDAVFFFSLHFQVKNEGEEKWERGMREIEKAEWEMEKRKWVCSKM